MSHYAIMTHLAAVDSPSPGMLRERFAVDLPERAVTIIHLTIANPGHISAVGGHFMANSSRTALEDQEKNLIDAYMDCAEAAWKTLVDRRIYEWKISFGLWAGLGAFAGFILKGSTSLEPATVIVVSVLLVIAGGVYTFWWTPAVRKRDAEEHATANYFWDLVEGRMDTYSRRRMISKEFADKRKKCWRFFPYSHWSSGSQVALTWALVLVALISILPKPTTRYVWAPIGIGVVVIFLFCVVLDFTRKADPDPKPVPDAADSNAGH